MSLFYFSWTIACFSFDDVSVPTPVVFATTTTHGHILLEQLFQINPVSMARPFDEFVMNPTETNTSVDTKHDNIVKKPDKD